MSSTHFDVIVLGGGTMGSAAAWELGKRGRKTLVLEQFSHVHAFGSHGGETRIFRQAYAESPDYVPLVRRADELWQELEAESGCEILKRAGGLELSAPGTDHARAARASADEHGIPYEWLDVDEVRRRWPIIQPPDGWEVLYSPVSGLLFTEPALRAMMRGAVNRGVELREHEPATGWGSDEDGVWVETVHGRYSADRLIIAAGAWAGPVLESLGLPLQVLRKVLWWFGVQPDAVEVFRSLPVFIIGSDSDNVYGFPVVDDRGFKVAAHTGGNPTTADLVDRTASDAEAATVLGAAQRFFRGVRNEIQHRAVCLYTMTPDEHFVIDRLPGMPNVVIAAGFSGHGFKFATAVGEHLVKLALDPTEQPLPILAIERMLDRTGNAQVLAKA